MNETRYLVMAYRNFSDRFHGTGETLVDTTERGQADDAFLYAPKAREAYVVMYAVEGPSGVARELSSRY